MLNVVGIKTKKNHIKVIIYVTTTVKIYVYVIKHQHHSTKSKILL